MAKSSWLSQISRVPKCRPLAIVAQGPSGVGKSSLGAAVPGCVFLIDHTEDGINTLRASGRVPAETPVLPAARIWQDVLSQLEELESARHEYKAVVVDTIGGLERLCHEHVCQAEFGGNWGDRGFMSFHKGYEVSLRQWKAFLQRLDFLRDKRGMMVLLLSHSSIKTFKNPLGEDYDHYVPDLHHKTWSATSKWADVVLFLRHYVIVETDGGRAKAKGGRDRVMETEYSAGWAAKNRHGLPPQISMGRSGIEAWKNLSGALKTKTEEVTKNG